MTKKWDVKFDRGDDECFFFTIEADRVRVVAGEIVVDKVWGGVLFLNVATISPATFCIREIVPNKKRRAYCYICGRRVYAEPSSIFDGEIEDCGCTETDDELFDEWEAVNG